MSIRRWTGEKMGAARENPVSTALLQNEDLTRSYYLSLQMRLEV